MLELLHFYEYEYVYQWKSLDILHYTSMPMNLPYKIYGGRRKKIWWSISMSWLLLCLKSFRSISSLFKYFTAKLLTWFLIVTLFISNSQGTMYIHNESVILSHLVPHSFFALRINIHLIHLLKENRSITIFYLLRCYCVCAAVASVQKQRDEKWLSSLTKNNRKRLFLFDSINSVDFFGFRLCAWVSSLQRAKRLLKLVHDTSLKRNKPIEISGMDWTRHQLLTRIKKQSQCTNHSAIHSAASPAEWKMCSYLLCFIM